MININYDDDGIHWVNELAAIARAMDFYLALENAYAQWETAAVVNQQMLSQQHKQYLFYEFSRVTSFLRSTHLGYAGYENRYEQEAGNWPLAVKTAVGYAVIAQQNITYDYCHTQTSHPCFYIDWLHEAFHATSAYSGGDRTAHWGYMTGDGNKFWAEGPYYFNIILSPYIALAHAARINNHYALPGITGLPYAISPPFFSTTLGNPLNWLADIVTPEGKTPPLDDGNKKPLYNAGLLRWTSGYGSTTVGQKFAWIGDRNRSNEFALPLELAIPRVPTGQGIAPLSNLGNTGTGTTQQTSDQQLVLRRQALGKTHYLLLNGESPYSASSTAAGAAITSGEGHEQPDNMQLLYYVDDLSYLMDSGYDRGYVTNNSMWNGYRHHNVLVESSSANGGLSGPRINFTLTHKVVDHLGATQLYRSHHGSITVLHGKQRLHPEDFLGGDGVKSTYERKTLFVEGSNPYLIDLNRNRLDSDANIDACLYRMQYHLDAQSLPISIYNGYGEWPSFLEASPSTAGADKLFIHPMTIEHRLVKVNSGPSRSNGDFIGVEEDDARERDGQITQYIRRLDICDDGGRDFGVATVLQVRPSAPAYVPKVLWSYTGSRKHQGWVWQQSATQFDVFVARSSSEGTGATDIKFNARSVNYGYPNLWLALPAGQTFGFARINVSGSTASLDNQYTVNLTTTTAPPLSVIIGGPSCAVVNQPTTFVATAMGGAPPYNYTFETQPVCSGGSALTELQGWEKTKDGSDGPGTNAAPGCDWSYAGGGANNAVSISRDADFYIRVRVMDATGVWATSGSQFVSVESGCSAGANAANSAATSEDAMLSTSDTDAAQLPDRFVLQPNRPNPFSAATDIEFALPQDAWVRLAVYDVLGHEIALLADEWRAEGHHAVRFDASSLPSGTYFYRLTTDGFSQARRMILLH